MLGNPSRKRQRNGYGAGAGPSLGPAARDPARARKIAQAIGARQNARFPRQTYGRMYVPRGTEKSLANFGASYKMATPWQKAERKQYGFSGRGAYRGRGGFWDDVWGGIKSVASDAWGAVRKPLGAFIGGGRYMRGQGRYMRGQGAYDEPVQTNNMVVSGSGHAPSVPTFSEVGDAAQVTISHKEYIRDVLGYDTATSKTGFRIDSMQINPGLDSVFPWLSQIAANYEEYEMHQCIVSYRSTVADFASTSGQVGTITMASKYNSQTDAYSELRSMMETDSSSSGKTSEHQQHGIECDPSKLSGTGNGKYIRTSAPTVNTDLNDYDHCQTAIAVSNIPTTYSNQCLGQLWVSYTVTLRKPRFWTSRGNSIDVDAFASFISKPLNTPFGVATGGGLVQPTTLLNAHGNSLVSRLRVSGSVVPGLTTGAGLLQAGSVSLPNFIVPAQTLAVDTAYAFLLEFDNSFTGDVEVIVAYTLKAGQAYGATNPLTCFPVGTVTGISDLYSMGGSGWQSAVVLQANSTNSGTALATAGSVVTGVYHLRLTPKSLNQSNGAFFVPYLADVGNIVGATVKVQSYNTTQNYKQNGSNDQVVYENPQQQLQTLV